MNVINYDHAYVRQAVEDMKVKPSKEEQDKRQKEAAEAMEAAREEAQKHICIECKENLIDTQAEKVAIYLMTEFYKAAPVKTLTVTRYCRKCLYKKLKGETDEGEN